jgi:hydrogenase maturation protease
MSAAAMPRRIICIGNRYHASDSAGPKVYDLLSRQALPPSIQLIDGGLGGLNLLSFLEDADLVVFVDAVSGFLGAPGVGLVDQREIAPASGEYDHNAGLAYLLQIAPQVIDGPMPAIYLIGVEGAPTAERCREAAEQCLHLITRWRHSMPLPEWQPESRPGQI